MNILLTGGSACGKSTFAEALAVRLPQPRYYLATMRPFCAESLVKIAEHQAMRAQKGFCTIEQDVSLHTVVLPERGTVLLECLCNLTANEMFDEQGRVLDVDDKILLGLDALARQCDHLIIVTNEVGSDHGGYPGPTQDYVQTLGRLNQALAQRADCVCELVCGLPLLRKGELPC